MDSEPRSSGGVAGRGVVFLSISKAYFMFSGFAIYFGLPRIMGDELFGLYAVVTAIVAPLNAVLVAGTIQAVSKFVSQERRYAEAVKRTAIRLQLFVGGLIFLVYFLLAPYIAGFENDPGLTRYLRLSSLIVLCYAFYAVYMGYVNGLTRFGKQACLDMGFSTLKLLLVLGLAWLGFRAVGAIGGFSMAALLILIIAIFVAGSRPLEGHIGMGKIFHFEFFIMLFTLIINLLLITDLLLLKALSPINLSYIYAAYYAAAQKLAFIPYMAINAVVLVIFPLISRLTHIEEKEKTRDYIKEALRYSMLITLLIAVLFSSSSAETIRLLFPQGYEAGAGVLSLLIFGIVFFSLLLISATIISGSGKPLHSVIIGFGTWMLNFYLNCKLIPEFSMLGAATATTTSMFVGLCVAWIYLRLRFGACLPIFSALRITAAAGFIYLLSIFVPATGLYLIGKFVVLGVVYILVLFGLRELGSDDLRRIKVVVSRTQKGGDSE